MQHKYMKADLRLLGIISRTTQQLDLGSGFAEGKLHPKSNIEMEEVRVLLRVSADINKFPGF